MKKILLLFSIILFLFVSCSSVPKMPGESSKQIENIYIEYINLGDGYFNIGNYEKAITYYSKSLKWEDTYWTVYYKLAKCYAYKSDWNNAEKYYKTLCERDPENSTLTSSLAYIYAMKGDLSKSEDMYSKLIIDYPEIQEYLVNYISVLLLDKKKSEAAQLFNSLKEQFPNNSNISKLEKQFEEEDSID